MKHKLNDPKFNILLIFIFEIIGSIIAFSADYSGAGMSAVIIKWIPAIIGLVTIIFYVIISLFLKKGLWIVTFIGCIFIIIVAINIHLTDFSIVS